MDGKPMAQSSGTAELAVRLNRLYTQAGRPTFRQLAIAAECAGLGLSTSSISNLLGGKNRPRWDTVRAFVLVCTSRTGTPATAADLAEWKGWYDYWVAGAGSSPAAPSAAERDIHTELKSLMRRFTGGPRSGGGYLFLLSPEVATVARRAKSRLDELSGAERAFLLTAGLFVGRGDGFGLYEFLPEPHASWAADSFAPLLASALSMNVRRV